MSNKDVVSSDARNRANKLNVCAQHVLLPSENADMIDAIRNDLIEQRQPAPTWNYD